MLHHHTTTATHPIAITPYLTIGLLLLSQPSGIKSLGLLVTKKVDLYQMTRELVGIPRVLTTHMLGHQVDLESPLHRKKLTLSVEEELIIMQGTGFHHHWYDERGSIPQAVLIMPGPPTTAMNTLRSIKDTGRSRDLATVCPEIWNLLQFSSGWNHTHHLALPLHCRTMTAPRLNLQLLSQKHLFFIDLDHQVKMHV